MNNNNNNSNMNNVDSLESEKLNIKHNNSNNVELNDEMSFKSKIKIKRIPILFRKIQVVGKNTYGINLPKSWINRLNLKRGDLLQIEEIDNNDLLIKPLSSKPIIKQKDFYIEASSSLSRDITRAYLLGYDNIIIQSTNPKGFNPEEIEEIENSRKSFPGAEYGLEDKNRIILKIIASLEKNEPYQLIHTMFGLTLSMIDGIIDLLNPKSQVNYKSLDDELERIKNIDEKINRSFFLIVRQLRALIQDANLRKIYNIPTLQIMDYRLISHLLENIGDNCVRICESISDFRDILTPLLDKKYTPKSINDDLNINHNEKNNDKLSSNKSKIQNINGYDVVFENLLKMIFKIKNFHEHTFNAFIRKDDKYAAQLIRESYGFPSDFKKYIEDCKNSTRKSNLLIILYRLYDIHEILIDICDLIQS